MKKLPGGTSSIGARLKVLGYTNYNEYLRSEHWQKFRQRFFRTSSTCRNLIKEFGGLRCQFCFADVPLQVHHRTYKRLGGESMNDVAIVCEKCHTEIHDRVKRGGRGMSLWKASKAQGDFYFRATKPVRRKKKSKPKKFHDAIDRDKS